MTDLFALSELASYLQRDLDTASATLARDLATGLIEDYTGPLTSGTSTITIPVDCEGVIQLPVQAITAVSTVVMGGASVGFVWEKPYPRLRLTSWINPSNTLNGTIWPTADVTLTHGWATVPAVVKAVALSAAARIYDNPRGMRTESVDDYSGTRAGSDDDLAGLTLTATELATLERSLPTAYTTSA